jgi:RNA polymerase sigma factor (TIGR02999 family)
MADHAAQSDCTPITLLLDQARDGDETAVEQVWRTMYAEIHQIATGFAARENVGSTIQASVLINEAYLRLFGGQIPDWNDRTHFLNTIAKAMGHFLIDHARSKAASKRGGGRGRVPLTIAVGEIANISAASSQAAGEVIQAIDELEIHSPEAAEVARLRFVLGLSVDQTAEAAGLASRTVKKKWAYAKAWLRRHLDHKSDS